ncbi:hypothetical protein Dimus_020075 [Dionaea muscipula]
MPISGMITAMVATKPMSKNNTQQSDSFSNDSQTALVASNGNAGNGHSYSGQGGTGRWNSNEERAITVEDGIIGEDSREIIGTTRSQTIEGEVEIL